MTDISNYKIIISPDYLQVNHESLIEDYCAFYNATQVRKQLIDEDYLTEAFKGSFPFGVEDERCLENAVYSFWEDWFRGSEFRDLDRIDVQVKRYGNAIIVKLMF